MINARMSPSNSSNRGSHCESNKLKRFCLSPNNQTQIIKNII